MDRFSSSSSDSSPYDGDVCKTSSGSRRLWCATTLPGLRISNSFKQVLSARISSVPTVQNNSPEIACSRLGSSSILVAATPARNIFLTKPCAVAGQSLCGKINVLPSAKLDRHSTQALVLELVGIEEVTDSAHGNEKKHTNEFFKQEITDWTYCKDSQKPILKSFISFDIKVPDWLGGSYHDKYSRVYYLIRGHTSSPPKKISYTHTENNTVELPFFNFCRTYQTGRNGSRSVKVIEEEVSIRANAGKLTSGDNSLYSSFTERNAISSSNYGGGEVQLELSLQRRIWVSGSTIFCSFRVVNHTKTMIKDIKIILLRRQNTYCQSSQNFQLMPVRSFCDIVSCTSIASLGCFDCLSSGQNESVILGLDTLHISVKNQWLLDVSYAIQALIESTAGVETMVEVPITLVHPHSVEPPMTVNMYKQAISHTTFSKLLNSAWDEQYSSESESDSEEEKEKGDEIKSQSSIFRQPASFTVLHPTDVGPSENLTRATLSSGQLKRARQTHKVNIVHPGIPDVALEEAVAENPSWFGRRLSSKRDVVRKGSKSSEQSPFEKQATLSPSAISRKIWDDISDAVAAKCGIVPGGHDLVLEPESNSPHRHSISTVGHVREQPGLSARHRLQSFRNSLRV